MAFLFVSCKQLSRSVRYKYNVLVFGESGGFTGAKNEYILKGTGKLYHIMAFSKDTTEIKTIDKKETQKIFKLAESKEFMDCVLDKPGNMNYFIRLYKEGKPIKDMKWSEGVTVPPVVKNMLSELDKIKP